MLSLFLSYYSINVIEIRAQYIPYDVMTGAVSSAEVSISWKCNDPTRSNEYSIAYTLTDKDQCNAIDGVRGEQQTVWDHSNCAYDASNIASCWMVVYELTPYSTYTYYVKSRLQGSTYQSTANNFRTNEATPSDFPNWIQNLIEQNTATSLVFSFNYILCGSRRGNTSYESEVKNLNTNEVILTASYQYKKENDRVVVTINALQCDTLYTFRVRGSNGNGELDGPYSSPFMGETSSCAPIDTIQPVVSCPPNQQAVAPQGAGGALVTYPQATAHDNSGGAVQLTYGNPSGTFFSIGQTVVAVIGRDPSGNIGRCTFIVTVSSSAPIDTIQPVVSCPPNQQAVAPQGAGGAIVTYPQATAHDNSGGAVQLTYGNPSGTFFSIGQTVVAVTGRDPSGNIGLCTFTVTVLSSDINECDSNPCVNGGCQDGLNQYVCQCNVGWSGTNCDINIIDECASSPCVNGGCQDGINQYVCQCNVGWSGTNCDINIINECDSNPCVNGGCQDEINQYMCQCNVGWTGTNCDIDSISECASNPCVNGMCQDGKDGINQYICLCDAGWIGNNCDTIYLAGITIESVLATSITFSWSEDACPDPCPDGITGYSYRLLQTGTGAELNGGATNANERMVIITGLTPCTEYSFSVAGISGGNTGAYSNATLVTTAEEVSSLTVKTISPTELGLSWDTPSASCADNVGYEVEYRLITRDQCLSIDNSEFNAYSGPVSGTSITLPDLYPHSTYEVRVTSGDGVATELAITDEAAPTGKPTNIQDTKTNTTITFTWNEPACTQRYGVIINYSYTFLETGSPIFIVEDAITLNNTVTFRDLEVQTDYTLFISAMTKAGFGPQGILNSQTLGNGKQPTNIALIAGSGGAGVIIIVFIIVAVVCLKYRSKKSRERPNDHKYEENIHPSRSIEMSRNLGYQQDTDQRVSSGGYAIPDSDRAQFRYYEEAKPPGFAVSGEAQANVEEYAYAHPELNENIWVGKKHPYQNVKV
ncbi:uncharacterized protein [Amphiura filiformis]|uniref:uncharacterized protein isoform X2 n=1 Tax=Amphiura filiformis TaxID=82378 RepID=UPI003B21374F